MLSILFLSLKVSFSALLLILIPSIALGYVMARTRFPGKSILQTLFILPIAIPPVAVGLIILELFSLEHTFGQWMIHHFGRLPLFHWTGAVIAACVVGFPFLFRSAEQAFQEVSPKLESMSHVLGRSRLYTFFHVALPLAGRGILYGAITAFLRGLSEFGATIVVAGNIPGKTQTLSLAIHSAILENADSQAWIFAGLCILIAFLLLFTSETLLRKNHG